MLMSSDYAIPLGYLGNLSSGQEQALTDFKALITEQPGLYDPERHDDHTLLRFLRARKFDLPKTLKMFSDYRLWFEEMKVDELVDDFDFAEGKEVQKLYPRFYHKTDKKGRPIYVERVGLIDVKKLFTLTTEERMIKNHIISYETLIRERFPACSEIMGHRIEQCCTILDLKDVSLMQASQVMGFIRQTSVISQNYYPEMMGQMFIINAPRLFSMVWKLITPLLDEVTVKKIYILGSDYLKTMQEFVSLENLPDCLNGSCVCDGGCTFSNAGPWNVA